jgi:WD40 repeat protein
MRDQEVDPSEWAAEVKSVEARIAAALAELVNARRLAQDSRPPLPYLRRHAVEHAAAADMLDERFVSERFLPFVDADRLRPLGLSLSHDGSNEYVPDELVEALFRGWRQVAHCWQWNEPPANADALSYWLSGLLPTSRHVCGLWRTLWRRDRPSHGEVLARVDDAVATVACLVYPTGPLAVASSEQGSVWAWELASGRPVGDLNASTLRPARLLAWTTADGRPASVAAGEDGTIRAWDLTTGKPVGHPITDHPGPVTALACTMLAPQHPIAVTAGEDGTIRAWDLTTGHNHGDPLSRHAGYGLSALACAEMPDGRTVAVTGADDGAVRLWDLAAVARVIGDQHGDTAGNGARSVACSVLPDGCPVAVTGGENGSVRVWDLAGHLRGDVRMRHDAAVDAVACGVLADGRPVAVTAGADGSTRLWDLVNETQIGDPVAGWVEAVTCARVSELPIAMGAGADDTLRVWELTPHGLVDRSSYPEDNMTAMACGVVGERVVAVTGNGAGTLTVRTLTGSGEDNPLAFEGQEAPWAMACTVLPGGRGVVVVGGFEGTIWLQDLATGTQVGECVTGHDGSIATVACATLPDGRSVAVTGGQDATIRMWDLTEGTPKQVGYPLHTTEGVRAIAPAHVPGHLVLLVVAAGLAAVECTPPPL